MVFSALLAASVLLQASAADAMSSVADGFFTQLKAGKSQEAYASLWKGTVVENRTGDIQMLAGQTATMLGYGGPVKDWSLVGDDEISPAFHIRTYVLRTQGLPLFFKIHFYNNGERWTVTKIFFVDDFDKMQQVAPPPK